jgi:glucose/arabinose dehydrogenase
LISATAAADDQPVTSRLTVPDGFRIEVFAEGLKGARFMALGPDSAIYLTIPPAITDTAHSAPLGCAFYTGDEFPEEYHGDLFVAYHGSWNRSEPTGYKVVRVVVEEGKPVEILDFVSDFLPPEGKAIGRPVDVLVDIDGSLVISDDAAGRLFRVRHPGGN